jgi:hypothetical protein
MRSSEDGGTVVSMRDRLEALLRNRSVQRAGDVGLALLLAASSLGGILAGGDRSWGANRPLAIVLALASTVPVAWRSRRPVPVAVLVLCANGGCVIAAAPHQAAFQPFVGLVLAAYSVGTAPMGVRRCWRRLRWRRSRQRSSSRPLLTVSPAAT